MKITAIKVSQPLGDFYLSKIKARDLLRVSTSSMLRYDKDGKLAGNQRPLRQDRLKAIANFIKSDEMCFPTSIIIAANVNERGLIDEGESRWEIELIQNDVYNIIIPNINEVSSLIIDGQHRLNSFKYTPEEFSDIEEFIDEYYEAHTGIYFNIKKKINTLKKMEGIM